MAEPYSHPDSAPESLPDIGDDSWLDLGSFPDFFTDVSTNGNSFNAYHGSSSTLKIDSTSILSDVDSISKLRPVAKSPFQDVPHGGDFVLSEVEPYKEGDVFDLGGEYDRLEDLLDLFALPNTPEAHWPTTSNDPVTIQISGPTPSSAKFDPQLPSKHMESHMYEAGLHAPRLTGSISLDPLAQGHKGSSATLGLKRSLSDAAVHSENRYAWLDTPWSIQVETPESLHQRFNSEPPVRMNFPLPRAASTQDYSEHVTSNSAYQAYQTLRIDARPASADPVPRVLQSRAPASGKKRKHEIDTLSTDQSYITNPPIVPSMSTKTRAFNHLSSNTHGGADHAWTSIDHRPSNYSNHLKPVNFSHYSPPDIHTFQLNTDSSSVKRSRTGMASNPRPHFPEASLPIPIDPQLPQARAYQSAATMSVESHSALPRSVITPRHHQQGWMNDRVHGPTYGPEDMAINVSARNVYVPAPINHVGPTRHSYDPPLAYSDAAFWPGSWSTSNTNAVSGIYWSADPVSLNSHVRLDTHVGSGQWSFEGGPSNNEREYQIIEYVPGSSRDDRGQDQTEKQIPDPVPSANSGGVKKKGAAKRDARKKRIPKDCCLPQEGEFMCHWGTCRDKLKFSEAEVHCVKKHKLGYKSDKSGQEIACLWHECSKECAKSGRHIPCTAVCAKSGISRHVLEVHVDLVYVCGGILKTSVNGGKPERCTYSNGRKYITTSHYVDMGHPLIPVNLTNT